MHSDTHVFALFVLEKDISYDPARATLSLTGDEYATRISSVLRLSVGDRLILFTTTSIFEVTLSETRKKSANFCVLVRELLSSRNSPLSTSITLFLPLLKKEHLEEAVRTATVTGITHIELIETQKSRKSITAHEFERLHKISIAACEQAKRFVLPAISSESITLSEALEKTRCNREPDVASVRIYFAPDAQPLSALASAYRTDVQRASRPHELFIGPEGGFTEREEELLRQSCETYRLSPYILKSVDVVTIIGGIMAGLLSSE